MPDKKPLPPQTAGKAWAAAFGALVANIVIWLLAYVDIVTTAETYGLLVTLFTPVGAGVAAYAKKNWQKVLNGPVPALLLALPLLGACAQTGQPAVDFRAIDHDAAAEFAISQVRTWNALGIDPLQHDELRPYVGAACSTLVGASAFVRQEYLTGDDILAWCGVVLEAVGAAPVVAPAPAPRP